MSNRVQFFQKLLIIGRRIVPVLLGLAALTVIMAYLSGAFEEKIPPGESSPPMRRLADQATDVVHELEKEYVVEAVGTLKAASRSVISAKILATIQEIQVSAGDFVAGGDVLVTLNTRELVARLQQAEESLAAAEAAADEARTAFERSRQLLESNAVSRREFDESNRTLNVAQANERRAARALNEAEVWLSYATITAPRAGRIVDRSAEPGDTVQPGMPILTLYDSSSLRLETPVLEHLAVTLTEGQKLAVSVDSINQEFEATVDEIVPQADAASRSFLVKASLPRSDHLYEGMYGRLQIPAGTRNHVCLATDAIVRIGQLEFVDVVMPDGTLQRRLIKTGRIGMPGRIEVLGGLTPGERVVRYRKNAGQTVQDQEADVD